VVASGTPPTLPELRAHVSARTAGYKAPRELVVLAELPRTDAGKIDRAALRRAVTGGGVGRCQEVVER
ncbi:MAG: hypothetical protein M3548_15140, partial [Actinomycetota bacterium]|nr:hypothetical protein [Actinomycetota bacterium]